MAVSQAVAQGMQAPARVPRLTKSEKVVYSVEEAAQIYGVVNIAGLPLMQADQKFTEAATGETIVVSTADIKFANKKGKPIEIRNVQERWAIFKDGFYITCTRDEAREVPWTRRVYFAEKTLEVIKEAQEADKARLLAIGVYYWDRLNVNTYVWWAFNARVALKSQASEAAAPQVAQILRV